MRTGPRVLFSSDCPFQGLLRLDHCFVTPKNEEATVLEVDVGKEQKGKVVMAPGDGQTRSEQD